MGKGGLTMGYLMLAGFCVLLMFLQCMMLADCKSKWSATYFTLGLLFMFYDFSAVLKMYENHLEEQQARVAIGLDFRKALHTQYKFDPRETVDVKKTIDASKIPTMKGLPMLGIVFRNPSPRLHYVALGTVASIAQTDFSLSKMHGYMYRNIKAYAKEKVHTAGQTSPFWDGKDSFSYTYQKALDPFDAFYVACHEEMHVAQIECKAEVNKIFQQKLQRMGRFVNLESCSEEVRCDLASIVRLMEVGFTEEKLMLLRGGYKHIDEALRIFSHCKRDAVTKKCSKRMFNPPTAVIYDYMFPFLPHLWNNVIYM